MIGLMVQRPINMSLPEPQAMEGYIERAELLLKQLHLAMTGPWLEGWDWRGSKIPDRDPFHSAPAMREPIFYGGELAYGFQYRDLASLKYR